MTAAACASGRDVESESRRVIPTPVPVTEVPPGTSPPATTSTTTPPPAALASVTFVLGEVRVEVGLAPTSSAPPSGGSNGFRTAVELDDGTVLASGLDAEGDGITPENGALWRSDTATDWTRVGLGLVAPPGLQEVADIVVDASGPRLFGMQVELGGAQPRIDALIEWRADADDTWAPASSLDETSVRQARLLGESVVTVGARDWNTPGGYQGIVIWHGPDGGEERSVLVDLDPDGAPVPGSEVYAIATDEDDPSRWVAIGNTTITDTARSGDERLLDVADGGFPSDVAIWWSNDSGDTWRLDDGSRFADVAGTQGAVAIEQVGGRWWMLVGEESLGNSFARRLYHSDDGVVWSLDDYRRPDPLTGNELPGARGLWVVDDIVVIVDEVNDTDGPSLVMTMIDPATGATDQHDLTIALDGLHQVNDVIELSDATTGLGFGRIERGPGASDLQVIEIRRDDPPPEPEPDDPLPTTTAPSSGGTSNA